MRETRLYGSEGGGAARSPYPYPAARVAPKREPNSRFIAHSRLGVFGDRSAEGHFSSTGNPDRTSFPRKRESGDWTFFKV